MKGEILEDGRGIEEDEEADVCSPYNNTISAKITQLIAIDVNTMSVTTF